MLKFRSSLLPQVKYVASTSIILCIAGYLLWQAVYSNRGILKYLEAKKELKEAHIKLQKLELEYANLEQRANLLNPENLNRDLVDEIAHQSFGLAHPKEKIVLRNKAND